MNTARSAATSAGSSARRTGSGAALPSPRLRRGGDGDGIVGPFCIPPGLCACWMNDAVQLALGLKTGSRWCTPTGKAVSPVKALVYQGPRDVAIADVPDARIERPTDVLVKVTSANICGSDLHMYEGRTTMETGRILGHENLGEVIETGAGVDRVKVGDRVCLPFNVGCGFCANCERGFTGFCLSVDSDTPGGAYGFAAMGTYAAWARRNTCGFPGPTSTALSCRTTRRRRRTTM